MTRAVLIACRLMAWFGILVALTTLVLLVTTSAHATTVGMHFTTKHSHGGYCQYNPGLYLRTDSGLTVGTYHNSECRQSVYLAQTYTHGLYSITLGGVTGYARKPVLPMVVPSVAFPLADGVSLRLAYVPKVSREAAHAVHLSVERRF